MRALVTGAANGLGKAFAVQLINENFDLVTLDREETALSAMHIRCDLAERGELDRILPVVSAAGPYDLALLNAGISATGNFENMPLSVQSAIMHVNLEAPILLCQSLVAHADLKPGATILFVSSLSVFTGYPGAAAYAASKEALAIFARSIRKPLASRDIRVCVAFPGPIRTGHASRHAPRGARVDRRMEPDLVAQEILAGMRAGRHSIVPGRQNRMIARIGAAMPALATEFMRKKVFLNMDGPTS